MNIKGLWDYDRVLVAKDDLEAELLQAKLTDTKLTQENSDLRAKLLAKDTEIKSLKRENEALKAECKIKWHYTNIYTGEGLISGWVPAEGTSLGIVKKYPAIFPDYMQAKKVPET